MRVLLVGRPKDRARVRTDLLAAGVQIAAESEQPPEPGSVAERVDAIVTATPRNGAASSAAKIDPAGLRDGIDDVYREPLTAREHEVLALLAEGRPNKAIAHTLGISDQTVKFHVAALIRKLGAVNRTDAVRRAIRHGLVAI